MISVVATSTNKNILVQPACTPTEKEKIETLQLNYFETNLLLLPHPNSESWLVPAAAISLSILGQVHTQEDVIFPHWKA